MIRENNLYKHLDKNIQRVKSSLSNNYSPKLFNRSTRSILNGRGITLQLALSFIFLSALFILLVSHTFHYAFLVRDQSFSSFVTKGTFMEVGTIISTLCTLVIISSYIYTKKGKRHPNVLLFYKSISDFIFSLRFLIVYDVHMSAKYCHLLAAFSQFFALSSECWFLCISIDLWFSTTNPFTNVRTNIKIYHLFSWGMGAVTSVILLLTSKYFVPLDPGEYCWFNDADIPIPWFLYYGIVVIFVLCAIIILILENQLHLSSHGMKESLKRRKDAIKSARIMTIAYSTYQLIVIVLWVTDVYLMKKKDSIAADLIQCFLALFHGSRGLFDLLLWIAINGLPNTSILNCCFSQDTSSLPERMGNDVDIDLQPQLNAQLRKEVIYFTTRGVLAAAMHTRKLNHPRKTVKLRIHELGMVARFSDYEPLSFREIRTGYGINDEMYQESFSKTCHERIRSGGSSGAFLFYTADYTFLVKSITVDEKNTLMQMLPAYMKHLKQHQYSQLARFYGCHSIHMYGQKFNFVVMSNVIGKLSMHEFYDIKGSWIHRNAEAMPPGKTMMCTYCNEPFQSGSIDQCEFSIRGHHMPHIVLRDNDLRKKLRLKPELGKALVEHISKDCDFLCSQGIMDYSCLISFHSTKYDLDENMSIDSEPSKRRVFQSEFTNDFLDINESITITDDDKNDSTVLSSRLGSSYYSGLSLENAQDTNNTPLLSNRGTKDSYQSFDSIPWIGQRQPIHEGYKACAVVGPDYYTLGMIDILQTWTWRKKLERFYKVYILWNDGNGISAMPPKEYAERFKRKIEDIVMIPHPSDIGLYYH